MKKKWFRTTDLINEEYLAEADPAQNKARKLPKRVWISAVAACACLALVLGSLWLLKPSKDTTPPKLYAPTQNSQNDPTQSITPGVDDDDYSAVIWKLSALKLESGNSMRPGDFKDDELVDGSAPNGGTNSSTGMGSEGYVEVTDNQTEGVIEADRIKRTDKHIFYLNDNVLQVFSIAGKESKEVGSIAVGDFSNYQSQWEFYLSADGKTATVMTMGLDQNHKRLVQVIAFDVSDPANITEKNRVEITGSYLSSRMTNGKILLMTEFGVDRYTMDFDDESTFLPQINGESIPANDIILPEVVNSACYTVVLQLDENTLEVEGQAACLSYSQEAYVSQNHIFLSRRFTKIEETKYKETTNTMTEITCLSYGDTFEKKGTIALRGYLKDKWSMDEYEGILRVVTTTNTVTSTGGVTTGEFSSTRRETHTNANLYCVDLETFQLSAKVENFAPWGEDVKSVRFDKNTAYVCTAVQITDPVFFFDLSDLNNITYKHTGNIDGFSTSLVNFGDGYLLGIGRENWDTFKVEIYREGETGVESVCSYTEMDVGYSPEYKSYYIDRENRLLGLGIVRFDKTTGEYNTGYLVLHFDGNTLQEMVYVEIGGNPDTMRGVYIDGYMYMFSEENFQVEKIF